MVLVGVVMAVEEAVVAIPAAYCFEGRYLNFLLCCF